MRHVCDVARLAVAVGPILLSIRCLSQAPDATSRGALPLGTNWAPAGLGCLSTPERNVPNADRHRWRPAVVDTDQVGTLSLCG